MTQRRQLLTCTAPPPPSPSRISGKSERNVPKRSVVDAFSTIKVQDQPRETKAALPDNFSNILDECSDKPSTFQVDIASTNTFSNENIVKTAKLVLYQSNSPVQLYKMFSWTGSRKNLGSSRGYDKSLAISNES